VRLACDTAGSKIAAMRLFKLSVPKVHAEITISNSRITYATLLLSGAAGFQMDFAAGSELGLEGNTKSQVSLPTGHFPSRSRLPTLPTQAKKVSSLRAIRAGLSCLYVKSRQYAAATDRRSPS
jgi:hypothetical protein